ncbi:hypothetical protein Mp_1g08190 [Marchantia polymorpha subsp. ruderalis]|uniref:SCP domain-containing protein n=2 Tax=Marchantia polymorpha TaxID=3197 RepID=A0AAF6AMV0_MARPO|nr:hypothetical protein MARPO_0036s0063 [Marchantia polymorpha]BBM97770.1 hypothetical protein Mp_1g08190 [Marchantia polymorpha subsp. ruderalis]|eukprot:PTQ41073.1 hypothetical protein MARPO_0036s0063 [Marchantia polymorpha]
MGFGLRPRILIHILVISLTASSIVNVAQSQSTAASTADEYLTPHNDARAGLNQGIPSLTWDTTLESYATDWAATRASALSYTLEDLTGRTSTSPVVWRDTAALAWGSATCPSGPLFVVCSYDPPGNFVGQLPH